MTWLAFPLEKQKSLWIKTRDLKISYGFGGHCNLCTLSWLCLFCNLNCMKSLFPDVFDEPLFLYASSFSPKSVSSSHYWTNTHCVGVLDSIFHYGVLLHHAIKTMTILLSVSIMMMYFATCLAQKSCQDISLLKMIYDVLWRLHVIVKTLCVMISVAIWVFK